MAEAIGSVQTPATISRSEKNRKIRQTYTWAHAGRVCLPSAIPLIISVTASLRMPTPRSSTLVW